MNEPETTGILLVCVLGLAFFFGFCIGRLRYDKKTKRFID